MTTTPPKPRFNRGDVILVVFPNSDLRTAKLRPASIVQADNLQTGLPQVIVAMITSNLTRANHVSRVLIRRTTRIGLQAGLRQPRSYSTHDAYWAPSGTTDRLGRDDRQYGNTSGDVH